MALALDHPFPEEKIRALDLLPEKDKTWTVTCCALCQKSRLCAMWETGTFMAECEHCCAGPYSRQWVEETKTYELNEFFPASQGSLFEDYSDAGWEDYLRTCRDKENYNPIEMEDLDMAMINGPLDPDDENARDAWYPMQIDIVCPDVPDGYFNLL